VNLRFQYSKKKKRAILPCQALEKRDIKKGERVSPGHCDFSLFPFNRKKEKGRGTPGHGPRSFVRKEKSPAPHDSRKEEKRGMAALTSRSREEGHPLP